MMTLRSSIAVTWILALISAASSNLHNEEALFYDQGGPSSSGTYFMLGFLPNIQLDRSSSMPTRQLLVTTEEPEPVNFTVYLNENLPAEIREGFPLQATVAHGEVRVIDFHEDIAPRATLAGNDGRERSKAIRIVTEGGKKISVQGFSDETRTSDGFTALSCDGMATRLFNRYEYIAFSAGQNTESSLGRRSVILLVPCEDDTRVKIEPTQMLTLSGLSDLPTAPPFRISASSSGVLRANAGQTLLIAHPGDLTGTIFRSTKPLAVFSGHECANVPSDFNSCDYIVEQIPPGLTWGKTFFIVPFAGRVSGDMVRVGTLSDGTQITVTCVTSPSDAPTFLQPESGDDSLIDRGEYLTYMTPSNTARSLDYKQSYCSVNASEPVVVMQYGTGFMTDSTSVGKPITLEAGDPFMSIIPPVTHYKNNYTATSVTGTLGPYPDRFINIAIAAEFFDNSTEAREQIKINGRVASPIDDYVPFYCSGGEICGYGAQFSVSLGVLNIHHDIPNYGIMVSDYAYTFHSSYGLVGGYELPPISATRAILEDITVPESAGTITISVLRIGDLNQRSHGNLNYRQLGYGEARVGEDFTHFEPVFLDYRGGNKRIEVIDFQITILDDDIAEPPERFRIYGENIQNLLFPFRFMTVTIIDDDEAQPPVVYFDLNSYSIREDGEIVTLVVLTTVAGGPPEGALEFVTEDGSASASEDYVSSVQGEPVIFASGEFAAFINISIQNDNIYELDETFTVRLLSTGVANVTILREQSEVTILNDDERSGVVSIKESSYEVQEDDEFVNVVITNIGNLHLPIHGVLTTFAGTANGSTDFSAGQYPFTIQPTEQEVTVRVPITDDETVELSRETFSMVLSTESQTGLSLGNRETTVYIIDDDVIAVSLAPPSQTLSEGSVAEFRVIAMGVSELPYSLIFQTSDGTAHAPSDYEPVNITLTREDIQGNGYLLSIPVKDDESLEETEVFHGQLMLTQQSLGLGYISLAQSSMEVTIIDNDVARIGLVSSTYTANEGDGSIIFFIQNLSPSMERDIVIEFSTFDGSATGGEDYVSKTESLTFKAGQSLLTVQVDLIDGAVYEKAEEEFSVRLTTTESFVEITLSEATAHIIDNDEITIQFNPTSLTVKESGSVELVIEKIGLSEEPVSVSLSTQPGSAGSSDYTEISDLELTFGPAESEKRVSVQTHEDSHHEGTETFTAVLAPVSDRVIITQDTAAISIEESTSVVVEFSPNSYVVNEKDGNVMFVIVKRTPSSYNVTVRISTVDGSAKSDSDFSPYRNKEVTFRPTESEKRVMVPIMRDSVFEGEESFTARLSLGPDSNGVVIGQQSVATTAIIDDIVISFSSAEYTGLESDGSVEVCLSTNGTLSEPATVVILAQENLPVDAKDGEDFTGSEYRVDIPAGVDEHCTHVNITDDSIGLEGDEQFSLLFDVSQLPDGMELGAVSSSSVLIIDNDVVGVAFEKESYGVEEGSGSVSVCVKREGGAAESFTVDVATSDSNPTQAEAGSDYKAVSTSLTFTPDDERKCFQIQVTVDQQDEEKEEFMAVITAAPQNILVNNQTRVTIISIRDSRGAQLVNDTVIADPLFTAPVGSGNSYFCYEIHGKPHTFFNLVSDNCTSVNAEYIPMNGSQRGNVIGKIGIKSTDSAGNCHNIEIGLSQSDSSSELLNAYIDGVEVSSVARVNSVYVRRYSNRVRVSVPNCELIDLVMWVTIMKLGEQNTIKFVITRGVNLTPTSHGLIGQFWNVPVTMTLYEGPLTPGYEQFYNRDNLYLITVTPISGETRTFLGEQHRITWDRRAGPCYYAGSSQGGRTGEREENDSVIEGHYTDYQVQDLFDDNFVYSQFESDRCRETS